MPQFEFEKLPLHESQAHRLLRHLITTGGDSTLGIIYSLQLTNPPQIVKTLREIYGFGDSLQVERRKSSTGTQHAFYSLDDHGTQRAIAMLNAMQAKRGKEAA